MSKFTTENQHEAKRRALAEARKREELIKQQQKKKQTQIATVLIAVAVIAILLGVVIAYSKGDASAPQMDDLDFSQVKIEDVAVSAKPTNYVKMEIEGHGTVILRLYSDVAPETVKNFQNLVSQGFYDGLTFHRIVDNFYAQGGDPKGDGTGNGPTQIVGEFTKNGFENNLSHKRGVLSMARGSYSMNSASCQFFICLKDQTSLDGQYASFGYVCYGMEAIDSLTTVERVKNSSGELASPVNPVVIKSMCFVTVKGDAGIPHKAPTAWIIFGTIALLCIGGVAATFIVTNRKNKQI